MTSLKPHTEIELNGQHPIQIHDHTRVYFGDYYRVRLEISCEIPLPTAPECCDNESDGRPATALYSRVLEKMAVPSAEVAEIKLALLAEFRRNSLPYLLSPDFPEKFLASSAARQKSVKNRFLVSA